MSTGLAGRRIVLLLGTLKLGGAERQGLLLARHLHQACGAELEVWAFDGPGPAPHPWEGIPWRVVPSPWRRSLRHRLRGLAGFARELRRARAELLIAHTVQPNVVGGFTWRASGARSFVWSQRDEGQHLGALAWERLAARWTPRFVSNSHHAVGYLRHELRVPGPRIQVIPNGVERAQPRLGPAAWRRRLCASDDAFLAVMVAHMHGRKDHATLLRAWREVTTALDAEGRRSLLVLAGGARRAGPLRHLAGELGIGGRVRFTGIVDDVAGLLAAADLGVFSSRREGVPNGVLECMEAGLAVAGTAIPGVREALGPAGAPFLAAQDDAAGLARAILALARDPALRHRVGAANRERVRAEFGLARFGERWSALLEGELAGARPADRP